MKTILGTANQFLDNGSIGPTKFYLVTSFTIPFAEWRLKNRIKHTYRHYQYSAICFDITDYIKKTDNQWLKNILDDMKKNDIMELDRTIYETLTDLIRINMDTKKSDRK